MKWTALAGFVAAAIVAMPSYAQQVNSPILEFGGVAFNHDIVSIGDLATLSQRQNLGTARSMAMGGAFTSLGADMVSMSLNPAGLGMYRSSEFSLTPMVSLSRASTADATPWSSNSKNRFAFSNFGAAFNIYQNSARSLVSATIGFGMSRIADFNSRYSFSTEQIFNPATNNPVPSIADIFSEQLQQGEFKNGRRYPIFPAIGENGNPNGRLNFEHPYFWPAVLGYKVSMTGVGGDPKTWGRYNIGHNASTLRSLDVINSGSINEFDISFGLNFNNIVYVGGTLGIQSIYKSTEVVYGEDYGYFNTEGFATDDEGYILNEQLEYSDLWQRTVIDGAGVNFKLGVIVRPVAGLRLGLAIHTPTYYSLDQSYRAGIESPLLDNYDLDKKPELLWAETDTHQNSPSDNWAFVSPTRLMLGASYTFGQMAIVSVDYERNWYNGIRSKNAPRNSGVENEYYNMEFKNNFCATNALRAGVEVKPLPMLAIRAGGGYTSSMLRDASLYYDMPLTTDSYFFSAGFGLNFGRSTTLDFAYQNITEKQSRYALFYSRDEASKRIDLSTGTFDTSLTRHYISMTLGFRF